MYIYIHIYFSNVYIERGGFLKWWYPNSWMVYTGKSNYNGWFGASTVLGNLQINIYYTDIVLFTPN